MQCQPLFSLYHLKVMLVHLYCLQVLGRIWVLYNILLVPQSMHNIILYKKYCIRTYNYSNVIVGSMNECHDST